MKKALPPGSCILAGLVVFIVCILLAAILKMELALAIAIVGAGVVFGSVIMLLPIITRPFQESTRGTIDVKTSGITLQWEVETQRVIQTVMPDKMTDSAVVAKAKDVCDQGRDAVKRKDLPQALRFFEEAARLDPTYWEPRMNIANIYVIQGRLREALAEATALQLMFGDQDLLFVRANLVKAEVMELSIQSQESADKKRDRHKRICQVLRESLGRCSGHLTTRISLGEHLLQSDASKEEVKEFLSASMKYPDFKETFRKALVEQKMDEQFKKEFPDLWSIISISSASK